MYYHNEIMIVIEINEKQVFYNFNPIRLL